MCWASAALDALPSPGQGGPADGTAQQGSAAWLPADKGASASAAASPSAARAASAAPAPDRALIGETSGLFTYFVAAVVRAQRRAILYYGGGCQNLDDVLKLFNTAEVSLA